MPPISYPIMNQAIFKPILYLRQPSRIRSFSCTQNLLNFTKQQIISRIIAIFAIIFGIADAVLHILKGCYSPTKCFIHLKAAGKSLLIGIFGSTRGVVQPDTLKLFLNPTSPITTTAAAAPPFAPPTTITPPTSEFPFLEKFCPIENLMHFKKLTRLVSENQTPFYKDMQNMLKQMDTTFALKSDDSLAISESRKKEIINNITLTVAAEKCLAGLHSTISVEYYSTCQPAFDKCINFFAEEFMQQAFNAMQIPLSEHREFGEMDFHINGLNPIKEQFAKELNIPKDSKLLKNGQGDPYQAHWSNWLKHNGYISFNGDNQNDYQYLWTIFLSAYNESNLIEHVLGRVNVSYNENLRAHLLSHLTQDQEDGATALDLYEEWIEISSETFIKKPIDFNGHALSTQLRLTKQAITTLLQKHLAIIAPLQKEHSETIAMLKEQPNRFFGMLKFNFNTTQWLTNLHLSYYFSHIANLHKELYVLDNEYLVEPHSIAEIVNSILNKLSTDDQPPKKYIAFPMQVSQNHWTLVFIDLEHKIIEYYDSKSYKNILPTINNSLEACANVLTRNLREKHLITPEELFKITPPKIPASIQPDDYECGPWTAWFLEQRLTQGHTFIPPPESEENRREIARFRKTMKNTLMRSIANGALPIELMITPPDLNMK